jgi:uncharacterized protein (DUF1697 family)
MADTKDQFIASVRNYVRAGDALIEGVTAFNAMNTSALVDLERGMSLTESFALRDSAGWSRQISALLEEFETARKRTRESAAVALMEEGRNISDVATAFGTTRQWASRLVKTVAGRRRRPNAPD